MTTIAIDFNDTALIAVGPEGVLEPGLATEPGYAVITGGDPFFGLAARRQARLRPRDTHARFWRELATEPLAEKVGPYTTSADLVHAHLQSLWHGWSAGVSDVIFVVPDYWSPEQLGLLLGIAEELAIRVIGLVDSAVASTRCHYEVDDLLHLDISLHAATVTRMKQEGGTAIESRQSIDGIGIERLQRACVEHIAARFLERTRFDPLHDASSEQALYDGLDGWLRSLQRSASVTATIERNGNEYAVLIERDGLVPVLASCYEPIMQHLRSRLTAGHNVAIQVTDRLAGFPGIVDAVDRLPQVTTFVLEPAAAARGALQRAGQFAQANGGIVLKTLLRWDRAPIDVEAKLATENSDCSPAAPPPASALENMQLPTHVLYAGRVYRIGEQPINIGSELAADDYGISLPVGNRGVSRRHCAIQAGLNGVELVDYSRFGTRLNGHAIDSAAILQAGDVISVGEPSIDLWLVTEVAADVMARGAGDGA